MNQGSAFLSSMGSTMIMSAPTTNLTLGSPTITKSVVIPKIKKYDVNSEIEKKWYEGSVTYSKKEKKPIVIPVEKLIQLSLKNSIYNWRTIEGMSSEVKIPKEEVGKTLNKLIKKGLVFSGKKKNGEKIYSSVEAYEKNTKTIIKFLDAVRGHIVR